MIKTGFFEMMEPFSSVAFFLSLSFYCSLVLIFIFAIFSLFGILIAFIEPFYSTVPTKPFESCRIDMVEYFSNTKLPLVMERLYFRFHSELIRIWVARINGSMPLLWISRSCSANFPTLRWRLKGRALKCLVVNSHAAYHHNQSSILWQLIKMKRSETDKQRQVVPLIVFYFSR